MRTIILSCILVLMGFSAYAQDAVRGKVVDKHGNPIPGVKLEIKGGQDSVFSGLDGTFILSPSVTHGSLEAYYSGMKPARTRISKDMTVTMRPEKSYYGMKAFGELAALYPKRLSVQVRHSMKKTAPADSDRIEYAFQTLAGGNDSGDCAILISLYNYGEQELTIEFDHPDELEYVTVELLDEAHELTRILEVRRPNGPIILPIDAQSAVLLLKAYKKRGEI